jgi:hypothetical protein
LSFCCLPRTNNAASGGFTGFSFPRAPRAIKNYLGYMKANGFPFDPSERPFINFSGNTVHSTGKGLGFREHSTLHR